MSERDLRNKIKNDAYRLLRVRPRSEFELKHRLKLKGYTDFIINECVEGLRRSGDIDDGKFAQFWVESRMHLNPVGDVVLRHELKEKGVSDVIIEATLDAKAKSCNEYEVAFSMAKERFERLKKLDRRKATKRLYDFLLRRGFKYDVIQGILDEMMKSI